MQKALFYISLLLLTACGGANISTDIIVTYDTTKFNLPFEYQAENEFAKVEYSFIGCFGRGEFELLLYERGGINYAGIKKDHQITIEARIQQAQIDSFDVFINELKSLTNTGFCTTTESYNVTYKNETFYQFNESCSWEGFRNLKKTLFGVNY